MSQKKLQNHNLKLSSILNVKWISIKLTQTNFSPSTLVKFNIVILVHIIFYKKYYNSECEKKKKKT